MAMMKDSKLVEEEMALSKTHIQEDEMVIATNHDDDDDYRNSNNQQLEDPKPRKKGGLITMPFIIVNESFEKVASYGLLPNMIFYLMNVYHLEAAKGTIILSLWSAISNAMAIFGGFLSDSYFGRFQVIAFGTLCSLIGTTLLWSTSVIPALKPSSCARSSPDCASATPGQYLVLFGSFGLISIGAGCVRPCSLAFGADQISNKDNPNNERVLDSFFNWYYASTGLSTIIALTVIVFIQDKFGWPIGFGVPACLMVLSLVCFLFGSPLYVHVKAKENLFLGLFQVPLAAFRKRKITPPPLDAEEHYFHGNESEITTPTNSLRCFNKACVIVDREKELNSDGSALTPWRLCTVERVENLKSILKIMPMWTTGIMMLIALNNSYTTLQAKSMNRHLNSNFEVPAGSFMVFSIVTITFWVAFYDRALVPLLAKFFGLPRGLGPKVRMGLGLLISCVALLVAGLVESIRRKKAIDQGLGLQDKRNVPVDMSAMWLIPQLVLLGLAEGLNAVGQIEFYYTYLSKSMSSIAMAIFTLGMAVSSIIGSILVELVDALSSTGGKVSWLSTNLNQGHVDYYYYLIAFLCLVNFMYFLVCARMYGPSEGHKRKKYDSVEDTSA